MPIRLSAAVRGQRGLIVNLFRCDRAIEDRVRRQTVRTGVRVQQTAFQLAPVSESDPDSFHMRDKIRLEFSPGGLAFTVGYAESDFTAEGKAPYGVFQELGFIHYLSGEFIRNPHIEPGFRAEDRNYRLGIRSAVIQAIASLPRAG